MSDWIRSLRGGKEPVSALHPIGVSHEMERRPGGGLGEASTVLIAGSECPFTCVFCDLWRSTLDGETPAGAVVLQLRLAIEEISHRCSIKLYNASNFFDPRAVPVEDDEALVKLLEPFETVVVECHPRFIGERCYGFAESLGGRLEVAIGLETVHPAVLPRLNKKMTLNDFDDRTRQLGQRGIGVRAFVLVGLPYLAWEEQVEWCVRSVEHAARAGAGVISIIPVRGGNGALEELAARGDWQAPSLAMLEDALAESIQAVDAVVQVDLWDLDRLAACRSCAQARRERLERQNLSGEREPRFLCSSCRQAGLRDGESG